MSPSKTNTTTVYTTDTQAEGCIYSELQTLTEKEGEISLKKTRHGGLFRPLVPLQGTHLPLNHLTTRTSSWWQKKANNNSNLSTSDTLSHLIWPVSKSFATESVS